MEYAEAEVPVVEERESLWERIKKFFRGEEVVYAPEVAYRRRLWDSRIERYLDENFDDYIAEYNLVTKSDLLLYEERYKAMDEKLKLLDDFTLDVDTKVTVLERRVEAITKKKK
ncbi:MAG: hypothetical protein AB1485_09085 [Candidatus Thermoplasmatota archaeon]